MENKSNTINEKEQERLIFSGDKKSLEFLNSLKLPVFLDRTQAKSSILHIEVTKKFALFRYRDSKIKIARNNTSLILNTLKRLAISSRLKDIRTEELFQNVKSIRDLLQNYRSIEIFKSYSHSQLIYHKNGESEAYSHTLNLRGEKQGILSVSDFNSLYTKIKKSKNKVFNQTDLQLDIINSVGAFLAKELITPEFSFVIILSRNDIFNPSDDEINLFEKVTLLNKFCASDAIKKDIANRHSELVDSIISNFPIEISYNEEKSSIIVNHSSFIEQPDYHLERLELMGELLNTLRHELSNPLFGINISSSLLKTDSHKKDDIYLETIDEISNSSKRCQNILENFTNLYDTKSDIKKFNLIDLIKETIVLTKSESKFFRPEVISNDKVENYIIESNPTLLSQVVFNLIVNSSQALKNMYEDNTGKITIYIKNDKDSYIIEVVDNGPGIPDELSDELFKPFVTTKEKGTGLGLTICKNIVNKLGGELTFSNIKQGSSFLIRIPHE